jgi:hypothetical protein
VRARSESNPRQLVVVVVVVVLQQQWQQPCVVAAKQPTMLHWLRPWQH